MKKQKLQLAILVGAMGMAVQSQAAWYDITFTGSSSAANGQIDVVGGVADSGYLDVTAGANQGTYSLVGVNSPLINGVGLTLVIPGGDQIFDDAVNTGSNPFLTSNGLEFANDDNIGFNLWGNGANSYSLFDVSSGVYVIDNGTATLVAVPEASSTARFAGFSALGLVGIVTLRRRFSKVA